MVNKTRTFSLAVLLMLLLVLVAPAKLAAEGASSVPDKQLIYDSEKLLNEEEYDELNRLANQYSAERETDILVVTYSDEGYDVKRLIEDFYDNMAPGFDRPHGNATILALNMSDREVFVAGFYKGETYLNGSRLSKIRKEVSPDLTDGNYKLAFQKYIESVHRYMGVNPNVNPDLIFFNIWVQLGFSLLVGWLIVRGMLRRSGSRITVTSDTYENTRTSGLLDYSDKYTHTSTTSRKIEKSSSSSSGGDGGTTPGGHSYSGSRGSF